MTLYTAKQFSVDSHGAYLTRLVDGAGSPILFEQIEIDGKRRGGSHVCLPYFGADAAGVLPQHGFGRDVEWDVVAVNDHEIHCSYKEMNDELFSGLVAEIVYRLNEAGNSFTTELNIANTGDKPLAVSPGFHPYFAVDPSDVRLNGERINLVDFEPYEDFPNTEEMTIETVGRAMTVSSRDLRHMVVWTNLRGDYLCVEPTHSGHSFDSAERSGNLLHTGEAATYLYVTSWGSAG